MAVVWAENVSQCFTSFMYGYLSSFREANLQPEKSSCMQRHVSFNIKSLLQSQWQVRWCRFVCDSSTNHLSGTRSIGDSCLYYQKQVVTCFYFVSSHIYLFANISRMLNSLHSVLLVTVIMSFYQARVLLIWNNLNNKSTDSGLGHYHVITIASFWWQGNVMLLWPSISVVSAWFLFVSLCSIFIQDQWQKLCLHSSDDISW